VRRRWWELLIACGLLVAASLAALAAGGDSAGTWSTGVTIPQPEWTPEATAEPLPYDRNLKGDLFDALQEPPELVVVGGSRAQRFAPSCIRDVTGLSAFNFALQNTRPEEAYAAASYMIARAPDVKLRLLFAVQATTFSDRPVHPGLLYDPRFAQWFPPGFVAGQKAQQDTAEQPGLSSYVRFSPRGCILYNTYDRSLENGRALDRALDAYLVRMVPKSAELPGDQTRSRFYFEKLLALFNERDVTPAIVVMPYHPRALEAFRDAGWQRKHDTLLAYLHGLEDAYDLRVLDYTEIESFGGVADHFYDGSHLTRQNARLLLEQAYRDAPECF
jgi:hypothetical protein